MHTKTNKIKWFSLSKGILLVLTCLSATFVSCKKFIEINTLNDRLLSSQVFANDAVANSAMNGIYRSTFDKLFGSLSIQTYMSVYADDLFNFSAGSAFENYRNNSLLASEYSLPWSSLYNIIYQSNAAIEGLLKSKDLTEKVRNNYIAEAKFMRAYSYFYLVNLFGDVPLLLTTDVTITSTAARVTKEQVYAQMIKDLTEAQANLTDDYSISGGDRVRANKWTAKALLSRVLLYQNNWNEAKTTADEIINSGKYSLLASPEGIFVKNNSESILQLANTSGQSIYEASFYIFTSSPSLVCTDFLLNSFETNDLRKNKWIASKQFNGKDYSYPIKYSTSANTTTDQPTLLRLGEQYLIRAEAKAMLNDFQGAIADVNFLRLKHGGLQNELPTPANREECLAIILRQRQVDLFTEGCHRFFDLKRMGKLDALMKLEKPNTWKSYAAQLPIPLSDILRNTSLEQNEGYK